MGEQVTLTWLPSWHAYTVRRGRRVLGFVVCRQPLPFKVAASFV